MSLRFRNVNITLLPNRERRDELSRILRSMSRTAQGAFVMVVLVWVWSRLPIQKDWYVQGAYVVLVLMIAVTIGIITNRLLLYRAVARQSRAFLRMVNDPFHDRSPEVLSSIAALFDQSHIARVVSAGLESARAPVSSAAGSEIIHVVERSSQRAAARIRRRMKHGLTALATIAATAPLVGLYGTLWGIIDSFKGGSFSPESLRAMVVEGLSEALVSAALGVIAAVPALWCYNYVISRIEEFDVEMENTSLELATYVGDYLRGGS